MDLCRIRQAHLKQTVIISCSFLCTCFVLSTLRSHGISQPYSASQENDMNTQDPPAKVVQIIQAISENHIKESQFVLSVLPWSISEDIKSKSNADNKHVAKYAVGDGTENIRYIKARYIDTLGYQLENLTQEIHLPTSSQFLNPCWYEEIKDAKHLYKDNAFIGKKDEGSKITRDLNKIASSVYYPRIKKGENWRLRCLPYFYIIGMAKCGTTDLWNQITSHPQVYSGLMKEYHWWSRARIEISLALDTYTPIREYIDLFDVAAENIRSTCPTLRKQGVNRCVTGEATVSTFWHCKKFDTDAQGLRIPPNPSRMTPGLLHRLQPNARLILILRDPISRLYSDYVFFSTSKASLSARDFHSRCAKAVELMNQCFQKYDLRTCVHSADLHIDLPIEIFKSIYVVFLSDWLAVFPREQLLVLHMESYSQSRADAMETVFDFLELDKMSNELQKKMDKRPVSNAMRKSYTKSNAKMLPETEQLLRAFFQPFNDALAEVLQDDRYRWR